eukprot:Colp12_sorted_trinity150504_noHs@36021
MNVPGPSQIEYICVKHQAPNYAAFVAEIAEISVREFAEDCTRGKGVQLFAAVSGCNLAGFISCRTHGATKVELYKLYVKPEYRRSGIGKQLCSHVFAFAQKAKIYLVTLWALENAVPFYRKVGFDVLYKIRDDDTGQLEDQTFLQKHLTKVKPTRGGRAVAKTAGAA